MPGILIEPLLCRALQISPLELAALTPEEVAIYSGAEEGIAVAQWARQEREKWQQTSA